MTLAPAHNPLPRGARFDQVGHGDILHNRPRKQSTAPAGLFAPAPEAVKVRPKPPRNTRPPVREPAKCGTDSGYRRHHRFNTEVCEPCRQAHKDRTRIDNGNRSARKSRAKSTGPRSAAARQQRGNRCGTRPGYDDHIKLRTPSCGPCRAALAAYRRDVYARQAAERGVNVKPQNKAQCGTLGGRSAHRRKNEQVCRACLDAANVYAAQMKAKKRAAA